MYLTIIPVRLGTVDKVEPVVTLEDLIVVEVDIGVDVVAVRLCNSGIDVCVTDINFFVLFVIEIENELVVFVWAFVVII